MWSSCRWQETLRTGLLRDAAAGGLCDRYLTVTMAWEAMGFDSHRDGQVPGTLVPSFYGGKAKGATVCTLAVNTPGQCR